MTIIPHLDEQTATITVSRYELALLECALGTFDDSRYSRILADKESANAMQTQIFKAYESLVDSPFRHY